MATPRGAEHRDLEQRLRNIERSVRELTSVALRREQLGVTEGDFEVSGGGAIIVRDGGRIIAKHDNGNHSLFAGPLGGAFPYAFLVMDTDGSALVQAYQDGAGRHVTLGGSTRPRIRADGDNITLNGDGTVIINGGRDSGGSTFLNNEGGTIWIGSDAAVTHMESHFTTWAPVEHNGLPTTSAGSNVNWNSANGRLRVVTSTRRHKADIRPEPVDVDAALALEPKRFTRNDEADRDDPPEYVGFIAEEAAELGLDAWVSRDESGEPWAFDYAQWCVALQAVVRAQAEQIKALEDRVSALEGTAS